MQTFAPYASIGATATVLDDKRLGKQRVETLQIVNALLGLSKGWVNHPATRMWRGYEPALIHYGQTMCVEWIRRGFKDTVYTKLEQLACDNELFDIVTPPWWGDIRVHQSHQSNLVRKFPEHYRRFFPLIADDLPYVWPVQKEVA